MRSGAGILTRRFAILASGALLLAPPASAHRAQTVLTTVMWNAAASTLDVMHRLHAHDAELCLQQKNGGAQVDMTVLRSQAQLMIYIEGSFALLDGAKPLALSPLGAELEGEAILLYQECRLAEPPRNLAIDHRILRDVFENQTNLVNVRLAQRTRTLLFSGGDGVQKAEGLL